MTHSVYALVDPRDMAVKYIGVSKNPAKRLQEHCHDAKSVSLTLRQNAGVRRIPLENYVQAGRARWLAEILGSGLEPLIVTLAILPKKEALEAEKEFIATFAAHTPLFQIRDTGINQATLDELNRAAA